MWNILQFAVKIQIRISLLVMLVAKSLSWETAIRWDSSWTRDSQSQEIFISLFTAGVRELLMHWARSSSKFHASVRLAGAVWFERLRQYDYQSGNIGGCEHFNIKCRKQNNHFLCFQYSGGLAIPGWVYFFKHTSIIRLEFLIFSLSVCFQCLPCELLQRVCAIFGCHVLLEIYWCRWTSNQFPRRRSVKNDTFIK